MNGGVVILWTSELEQRYTVGLNRNKHMFVKINITVIIELFQQWKAQ